MGMKRLLILVVLVASACSMALCPRGWLFAIGLHPVPTGTPWTYQLYSGFLASLAVVSVLAGIATWVRSMNCQHHGCWRVGRYLVAGGHYKVCRKHHPEEHVRRGRITMDHIVAAHRAHQGQR